MPQLASHLPTNIAPHAHRTVLIAPNLRVNLAAAGHPLANLKPRTELGRVALDYAMATSTSLISVAATTAYVYSITGLSLPIIQFRDPPPGTTIPPQALQESYNAFEQQLAICQGQASAWINTQPGTSSPSVFSQLVAIPRMLTTINGSVQSKFTILAQLPPGSPDYNRVMQDLKNLISAEIPDITTLNASMMTLGTNLLRATDTIDTAASTGVLGQLCAAYASEMAALDQAIKDANAKIASDNQKIIGLGFATGASIVIGMIGLANFWNPIGWIMIAGGAIGAYFALAEIMTLKGDIARQKATIQTDTAWKQDDSTAAAAIQGVVNQTQGFAAMDAAAQEELKALENLLTTLTSDINTALGDLNQNDVQDAWNEWNEIMAEASVLSDITAYVWPSPILLPNPTAFAAAASDVYTVGVSGQASHFSNGAWTSMADKNLSIVAAGSKIVGINGAPADGAEVSPTPYPTNYFVKLYNTATNTWTTISTFAAAQVATDGASIYAINQMQSNRQVFKYSGSGTTWSALPAMPNSDAPQQLAIAAGKLFAITTNFQKAYVYDGTKWSPLGTVPYADLAGNGSKVGLVDTNNCSYLYDASKGTFANQGKATGSSVARIAQVSNGDQYFISSDQQLCHINNQVSPPVSSVLKSNIVGIAVSDTNVVYCSDNQGNSYKLIDPASNQWQMLPASTSSGN